MNNIVEIVVSGGVADVVSVPKGIIVHIKDYDVDGCDDVLTDEYGEKYILGVYKNS